jgi:poly(beta-D-mannuronate) lyase
MSLRRIQLSFTVFALLSAAPMHGWSQSALQSSTAPLKSPWKAAKNAPAKGDYNCPAMAALPHDIVAADYYSDAKHSIIDPTRYAAYNKAQEVFRAQLDNVEAAADTYQKNGNPAAVSCVVKTLMADAAADAMTGSMSTNQAEYVRHWTLGALAVAYLKVQQSPAVAPADNAAISAWMLKVGDAMEAYFEARRTKGTDDGRNNHLYWAGFSAMGAGIVANDHSLFDWGASTYYDGVHFILPDGTLPLEMNRGQRALHYHLFALAPLVMMAEFGEDNGIRMYAENNGAMHLLIKRTLAGLIDNSYFTTKAGAKQDTPEGGKVKTNDVIWAVPYVKRFPDPAISKLIDSVPYKGFNYLGGLPPR